MSVNEIVTEFKFKGDTKPLEQAGKNMEKVSENSGFASKRMDGAGASLKGLINPATMATAGFAALGGVLAKATQEVFKLGKEGAELRGLGINQGEFKQAENLFVKLGSNMEDAGKFTRDLAKAQNELSLGKDSAFARSLEEEFGVAIEQGESVNDVLKKLRESSKKMGLTAGQISVKAGELGFSPEFQKVLLATNAQFAEATREAKNLAQTDEATRQSTEEANQAMKEFSLTIKRLWERMASGLVPVITAVVKAFDWMIEQLGITLNFIDENLADGLFALWDGIKMISDFLSDKLATVLLDLWAGIKSIGDYISTTFMSIITTFAEGFKEMWRMVEVYVFPIIQKMVDVFYLLINSVREAISKIPFVGEEVAGEKLIAPKVFGSSSSVSNRTSSNVSNRNTTQTINVQGLTNDQLSKLIGVSNRRNVRLAGASL